MLKSIGQRIWEFEEPLKVVGFQLNHRMTVMVTDGGEVVVHSPVGFSTALHAEVAALGPVKWIVAPSRMHNLFLKDWMQGCLEAVLLHSSGMKILGVPPDRITISDESARLLGTELECLLVRGMPKINEVAWFHRPSRSIIVADLLFNLTPGTGFQRWMQKATGVYRRLGPSRMFRMFISDQAAFRDSLEKILSWDFDRIILGHGANINTGGKKWLQEVFGWLWP